MDKIWANRLIAGDKTWEDVPERRIKGVTEELAARVVTGEISEETMNKILGEA